MVEIEEVKMKEEKEGVSSNEMDTDINMDVDVDVDVDVDIDSDGWQRLMGDDLLMKVIDNSEPVGGREREAIQPQDAVLIDFVARIASHKEETDGPVIQEAKNWMVVIGEGDVMPCLEMAIRFLETGQMGLAWSHSKFAFGPGTRSYTTTPGDGESTNTKQLPPNSSVMFEVKVIMKVMDTSRLNPYFTIQKATTRKAIANDIYQYEWCAAPKSNEDPTCEMAMNRAIRLYTKAAKEMESLLEGTYFASVENDHPQRHQAKQVLLDCLNNIVAVQLRQREYHKAKQSAVEVLKQDPKNIKALLRAAKAALLDPASTLEEVEEALKAAEEEITYKNPEEEKQLKQLKALFKKKRHEYKEQTKAMFGSKLKGTNVFASEDDKKENSANNEKAEEGKEEKNTESENNTGKSVSFDENPKTRMIPNRLNSELVDNEAATFWKTQGFTVLVQVILPMALYYLYRMMTRTTAIGENTSMDDEEAPTMPNADEVINLDE